MGRMVGNMSQREYPWVKEDKELMESDPDPKTFKDSIWAKNDKPIKDEPMLAVFNDKYPCKEGHRLYITKMPKDAPGGIGYAFQEAFSDGMEMIKQGKIDGFNLGMNIGASAGQSVTRVTDTTPNSSQVDNFRSDSGTLAAVVNGSTSGSVTFDGTNKNATYTDLRVSGYADSPADTPGFYTESDAQIRIASALSSGWNRIQMTKSDTDNTNEVYFVVDDVTASPTIASGTISGDSAGSYAYSSGIEHFASGGTVTISNLTMTNLAGETYYNGNPISISGSDSIISSQSKSYTNVGVSTPITRQTTSAQSLSAQTVNINGSNRHG